MKLLESVRPITNAKKAELERELEEEKERFRSASQEVVEAVRSGISLREMVEDRPVEAAIVVIVGGFAFGRFIQLRRQKRRRPREAGDPDLP